MKLGDPRRMQYCRASSEWMCDYPECSCNLTHDDPPEEKQKKDNKLFCPQCGTVLCKGFNTDTIYIKIKCKQCKNTYSINLDKNRLTIKIIDV